MTFSIGDLVLHKSVLHAVWSKCKEDNQLEIISLCAEQVFSVSADQLTLVTTETGPDPANAAHLYKNGDIVNFCLEGAVVVGMIVAVFADQCGIEREVHRDSKQTSFSVSLRDVLQPSRTLVQTLFRTRTNNVIVRLADHHRRVAAKASEDAAKLAERIYALRTGTERLRAKLLAEKENAEHCRLLAALTLDSLI